jgi:hypothetical protein
MNAIVTLDAGAYETDADTAAAVRADRVPTDADPGWRPLTLDEARRRHPAAVFTPVTAERTPPEHVEPVQSDADVLAGLIGSTVFDRPAAGIPDDPDVDD